MNRRTAISTGAAAALGISSAPLWSMAASTAIARRSIPSTGELLPCVGLGTWLTFDIGSGNASAMAQRQTVVKNLIAGGSSVIDSSPMYGQSESTIGTVVKTLGTRKKLFLATKVWTSGEGQGKAQIAASTKKMSAGSLDLIQIHNLVDWKTHMRTLLEMKDRGEVRYVGITHYLSHAYGQMEQILKDYPIDFIQCNYNVTATKSGDRLLPAAAGHGKAVIINRPFAGGTVFRQVRNKSLPTVAEDLGCTSWAQLLLRFVLSNPAVTCAIPGTSRGDHMLENVRTGAGEMATEQQQQKILTAFRS